MVFQAGEARRRGGGTIQAASMPPPEFAGLVGCAALGGRSALGSPRGFGGDTYAQSLIKFSFPEILTNQRTNCKIHMSCIKTYTRGNGQMETVDRTILFGVLDWRFKNNSVDVPVIFKEINKLSLNDGSRYYQTSAGQRYEVLLKSVSNTKILGCIGDSRITDLPFLEKQGNVSPLKIEKDEGIFDAMHFYITKNVKGKWIIVYEFNFYAPRITALNIYVQNKIKNMVDYVAINPVSGETVTQILKRIKTIKKINMGIHAQADVSGLSSGLADALKALRQEQNGTFVELAFSVRYAREKSLAGNIIENIPAFFKTISPEISMEYFKIAGTRKDNGQKEEVNLMDIILRERKTVEKLAKDHRFVDPDKMYIALEEAYLTHKSLVDKL
jgi:hypothetical protein